MLHACSFLSDFEPVPPFSNYFLSFAVCRRADCWFTYEKYLCWLCNYWRNQYWRHEEILKTSIEEILYTESKKIFSVIFMNLKEWSSNSVEFNESLPTGDRDHNEATKVLGLICNKTADVMTCQTTKTVSTKCQFTKKKVLQSIAEVFDPISYFSPITIRAKFFLQELWK